MPGHPAVALELRLAGAAGADAAAEALEVLPHAAHPRQVVLELRELDLQLSLGADGVLGEDVEDQLRAIDDARREGVLERPLLGWIELVVDDEDVGAAVGVERLQLLELALARRTSSGRAGSRCWTSSSTGSTSAVRVSSRSSPSSSSASAPFGSTASRSPFSGSSPAGVSDRRVMERVCRYARDMTALAERLAERTLELVDIPSESLHEAAVRAHLLSLVPAAFEAEYAAEDAFVFARPRRPGVPLVLLVGHYDTVPAQGNVPGGSRTAPFTAVARPT